MEDDRCKMRPGSYALFMTFVDSMELNVGRLGTVHIDPGMYCYIGSAMNGLDQRIARHLRKDKKIRWHIDNLTVVADEMEVYESLRIEECELRRIAEHHGLEPVIRGFGCSDCRCDTHLLRSDDRAKAEFIASACLVPHGRTE